MQDMKQLLQNALHRPWLSRLWLLTMQASRQLLTRRVSKGLLLLLAMLMGTTANAVNVDRLYEGNVRAVDTRRARTA